MESFFESNKALINEWVEAALNIKEQFGLDKAAGYLIGEKFYNFVSQEKRLKETSVKFEEYNALIDIFSSKIKEVFLCEEIRNYFSSNPRFGALGHALDEKQYRLFVEKGATDRSLDTEIEDALILGKMKKYLNLS